MDSLHLVQLRISDEDTPTTSTTFPTDNVVSTQPQETEDETSDARTSDRETLTSNSADKYSANSHNTKHSSTHTDGESFIVDQLAMENEEDVIEIDCLDLVPSTAANMTQTEDDTRKEIATQCSSRLTVHLKNDSIESQCNTNGNNGLTKSIETLSGDNASETDSAKDLCLIHFIPNEILQYIFSFLTACQLSRAALVCKKWHEHASNPVFWTKLVFKHNRVSIEEVCRVILRMEYVAEIDLQGLENLQDEDFRQIASVCPPTIKTVDLGFLTDLGRDTIVAITEYLPNIEKLNLEGARSMNNNCITALIKLRALTDLNISHCPFFEDIHVQSIVSSLPLLETVNIDGLAEVSDATMKKLWHNCGTWLKHLFVDGANLTDVAMDYISRCTELQTFSQHFGDNITDVGLRHIMQMQQFTTLKLRKFPGLTTEVIAQQFLENEALANLTVFELSECIDFNDSVVVAMTKRCINLHELTLDWCWDITDLGISAIVESLPQMRRLSLAGLDKIKGHAFVNVPEKMPKLKWLDLRQCNEVKDELLRNVVAQMPDLIAYNYYGLKFGSDEENLSLVHESFEE